MAEYNSPLSMAQRLRGWGQIARQVIDLRLALVMALLAFVLVVSLDSAENKAEAADLANPAYFVAPTATMVASPLSTTPELGLAPDTLDTAHRLHHGLMTSAILTSNRLTEAHLFTDYSTNLSTD